MLIPKSFELLPHSQYPNIFKLFFFWRHHPTIPQHNLIIYFVAKCSALLSISMNHFTNNSFLSFAIEDTSNLFIYLAIRTYHQKYCHKSIHFSAFTCIISMLSFLDFSCQKIFERNPHTKKIILLLIDHIPHHFMFIYHLSW